ncbi:1,2-dihydroxy-3-keto-5-methylthiopentene dioxygenase [Herbidospora yilanensis]|uniref:1,2-dihydroxy-3-keto-5-methylthiopentene dioxygenase n=1 Tax=Herbidospora yilanensis TaxID=354426 RepID=UPI000782262C|nr:cupin [Herbidospora yilanensis]
MTYLTVYGEDAELLQRTENPAEIAAVLSGIGVDLRHWDVVATGPTADDVLAAYAEQIAEVNAEESYTFVDVVQLGPDADPEVAAGARAKFLDEHTHDDDEVRFFARGAGIFYLHVNGRVHAVLCEAGDLLSVPAKTTHWFDMGTRPDFCAIRFFHDDDGWVGDFTGDAISSRIPDFDTITAGR